MSSETNLHDSSFVEIKVGECNNNGHLVETLKHLFPASIQMYNVLQMKIREQYDPDGINFFRFYSYECNAPIKATDDSELRTMDVSSRDWSDPTYPLFLVCLISTKYHLEGENPCTYRMIYSRDIPSPSDSMLVSEFSKLFNTMPIATGDMVFATVDVKCHPFVAKVAASLGKTMNPNPTWTWALYLPTEKVNGLGKEIEERMELVSNHFTLGTLMSKDALTVNSNWKWASGDSLLHIREQIERSVSAGVFCNNNNDELASWGIMLLTGTVSAVHTRETYRRRGFGELIIKSMCLQMMEKDMIPLTEVELETTASKKMMSKLGFEVAFDAAWISWRHA